MKNTTSRFVLAIGILLLGIAQMVAQDQSQLHAAPAVSTDRVAKEVRHELLMLPYYDVFDNIEYKVEGYNVTLVGYVTNPVVKSDAGNAVKRIEGVERLTIRSRFCHHRRWTIKYAGECFAPSMASRRCRSTICR